MDSFYGLQELLRREVNSVEEKAAEIRAVDRGAIKKLAGEIFVPEKLNLALVGPSTEENKFLKILKI